MFRRMTPAIVGCDGLTLSKDEYRLYREHNPFGLILYSRNLESVEQVQALTASFRECVGRDNAPVLIDQEGGRVARLNKIDDMRFPSAETLGKLAEMNINAGQRAAVMQGLLMGQKLRRLGISVNCAPVLDLQVQGAHSVIGDRSYGDDPLMVSLLGGSVAAGLCAAGVFPIMKHIPGHGRASKDSHHDLPYVETPLEELYQTDFVPFRQLRRVPMAMPAHIVYPEIDPKAPVTLSPAAVTFMRKKLGYKGLLVTDDIGMNALEGSINERAIGALRAGCDVVLYGKPEFEKRKEMLEAMPSISLASRWRWLSAQRAVSHTPLVIDEAEVGREFNALIARVPAVPDVGANQNDPDPTAPSDVVKISGAFGGGAAPRLGD